MTNPTASFKLAKILRYGILVPISECLFVKGEICMEHKNRSTFSNKMGFILSAAGASVGLGNIWRFPYLAARYGGGIFLLVYIVLALTFGYTMIISETALGRMTGKSPVGAFERFGRTAGNRFGGWINAIIPMLIVPYYSVIGGWVCKYLFEYLAGHEAELAEDAFFGAFIGSAGQQVLWFCVFAFLTLFVIFRGVENGIERVSRLVMPVLVVLAVVIAAYSMSRPGALAGVKYFLVPDFAHFSWMTVVAALGQMFYSLSIAMGILVTFGSYMKKDVDMETSTIQVEIFDTMIAVFAGLMIIPAVFAFSGGAPDVLQSGPSLMFVTMPKIFLSMGFGRLIGILFFVLVLFAAVTSAIALTESCVSTFEDELHLSRRNGTLIMGLEMLVLGILNCLGFNILGSVSIAGMGILDFFDFTTNSIMMPVSATMICLLVLRKITVARIEEEVTFGGSSAFRLRGVYRFVVKYIAIAFLIVILISSVLNVLGIIHI